MKRRRNIKNPDYGQLISVVITTCNRATLLCRALESVIRQSYENLEIIVVDDGSTDQTSDVVSGFCEKDSRVRYIRNERSCGACMARNRGVLAASGEYITHLDDDDIWQPLRMEKLMAALSPDVSAVYSDSDHLTPSGKITKRRPCRATDSLILRKNVTFSNFLTQKRKIIDIGMWNEDLPASQDHDILIRLIEKWGTAYKVSGVLITIDQTHGNPRITTSNKKFRGMYMCYKLHKHKMSRSQRKYQLYRLFKRKHEISTLRKLLAITPIQRVPNELLRLVKSRRRAPQAI